MGVIESAVDLAPTGVIDSRLDVGVCGVGSSEGEVEVASWVLWSDGAADCEVVTLHHL